jgi:hypothetical protein
MPTANDKPPRSLGSTDWRAWLALAWVVVFGLLYARTTIEQRGGRVRAAIGRLTSSTLR